MKMQKAPFQKNLFEWYQKNHRKLPFRESADPYHIWLSEIMAQQTTMSAVLPYYERFLRWFPSVQSVAEADEDDLLKLWQGLGYYSRVRAFHHACRQVMNEFDGKIPKTSGELKKLKGIGDYTAAAIASICFGEKMAVVDGNVRRVIARLYAFDGNPNTKSTKEFFELKSRQLLNQKNPGDHNQAMMELGAMVCRPKKPLCATCPVHSFCEVRIHDKVPENFPVKIKQDFIDVNYHSLIVRNGEKILLKKPSPDSLIKGMWELPSHYDERKSVDATWKKIFGATCDAGSHKKIGKIRHSITNKKIITHVYESNKPLPKAKGFVYHSWDRLDEIPLNTLSRKILTRFIY